MCVFVLRVESKEFSDFWVWSLGASGFRSYRVVVLGVQRYDEKSLSFQSFSSCAQLTKKPYLDPKYVEQP